MRTVKIKSVIKTALVCIAVLLTGIIIIITAGNAYTESQRRILELKVITKYEISSPDKFIGKYMRYQGNFGGKVVYTTYKLIEGKVVYTGFDEYSYGIAKPGDKVDTEWPTILGSAYYLSDFKNVPNNVMFNEMGQREMDFYYPFVNYKEYKDDFKLLNDIDNNKYIEMALSLDKAYSADEIKNLFPKRTHISWYWIDDLSSKEKQEILDYDKKYKDYRICSENRAYGIKTMNSCGIINTDPFGNFTGTVSYSNAINKKNGETKRLFNNLSGKDGKLTTSDLKIEGVVVTGTPQSIKSLEGMPFVKASSLGVVTDMY